MPSRKSPPPPPHAAADRRSAGRLNYAEEDGVSSAREWASVLEGGSTLRARLIILCCIKNERVKLQYNYGIRWISLHIAVVPRCSGRNIREG